MSCGNARNRRGTENRQLRKEVWEPETVVAIPKSTAISAARRAAQGTKRLVVLFALLLLSAPALAQEKSKLYHASVATVYSAAVEFVQRKALCASGTRHDKTRTLSCTLFLGYGNPQLPDFIVRVWVEPQAGDSAVATVSVDNISSRYPGDNGETDRFLDGISKAVAERTENKSQ